MIIDTHAHFLPASFIAAAHAGAAMFPSVALTEESGKPRFAFAGRSATRPAMPRLADTSERLAWMTAQGIDRQVVGGWLDMFGYELPAVEGEAWSRLFNEHLLAAARQTGCLIPLATVPLQDGKRAAQVLADALAAGFSGAMIGTQPHGEGGNLDDPALDPFWETASRLEATVFIHPMFACGDPRILDYGMMNAVGRATDTTIAASRLLFSGHLQRFPGMRLIVSHGGGALPWLLGRLQRNHAIHPGKFADPLDGFRRLYFDTVLFEPEALRFLCRVAGTEHVVLGSDYPFPIGDLEPMKLIRNTGLETIDVERICGTNAARLFQLPCQCATHATPSSQE
jgi:aminocarboxymuconate-semialdehyde decarboxylase